MTRFLAFAGLLVLACNLSFLAYAQTATAAGVTVDLHPIVSDIATALAAAAAGAVVWLARLVGKLLNIRISAQSSAQLEQAAYKAATFGLGKVQALIAAKGWDHPEVKSQAVALAIPYLTSRFPGALKAAGVNLGDPVALAAAAEGLLERIFPTAAMDASQSPATPPAALTAATIPPPDDPTPRADPVPAAPAAPGPVAAIAAIVMLFCFGLGLSACTVPDSAPSPDAVVYASAGILQQAEVAITVYARLPNADPAVIAKAKQLDTAAYQALEPVVASAAAGGAPIDAVRATAARVAITALTDFLATNGVK